MKINETFISIDGEYNGWQGIGQPTFFIRCQGCNLRCPYCDTIYAQEGDTAPYIYAVSDLVQQAVESRMHKVTITGGEPLLQKDELVDLISRLARMGIKSTVETNGTQELPHLIGFDAAFVSFIVDYKFHVGGMHESMPGRLGPHDAIKFIITTEEEYEQAQQICRTSYRDIKKILSPVNPNCGSGEFAKLALQDISAGAFGNSNMHISVQLHKLIGVK